MPVDVGGVAHSAGASPVKLAAILVLVLAVLACGTAQADAPPDGTARLPAISTVTPTPEFDVEGHIRLMAWLADQITILAERRDYLVAEINALETVLTLQRNEVLE